MHITVTSATGDVVFPLEIPDDLGVADFKAFCEAQSDIPSAEMLCLYNGRAMDDDKKKVSEYGLKDGEMVVVERRRKKAAKPKSSNPGLQLPDFGAIRVPGQSQSGPSTSSPSTSSSSSRSRESPEAIMEMLRASPSELAMLKQNNPVLGEAFEKGVEQFTKVLKEQQEERRKREVEKMRIHAAAAADPFNMEAQRMMELEIQNKNIDANMELAMEYNPESFGTVIMLYINCKVNGHPIKAFVDSGAQATIMSQAAAERCGIQRLVDKRFAGIAKGVGTQKIIGRVHMVQIQIEDQFLTSSFSILEEQPMDMLLGLDMLKRHQCCIDLKSNELVIGSAGVKTRFLPEAELPECARLSSKASAQAEGNLDDALKESARMSEERQMQQALQESKRLKQDSTASASSATEVVESDKFSEQTVTDLMKFGFPRDKVIAELREYNGDVTKATAALLAKSLKGPSG